MKPCAALLIALLLLPAAYADDAIEQDVSSLLEGMDTSAIDGNQSRKGSGSGNTAAPGGVLMTFDFSYGSESGLYGPMRFNMTKRNLKKLERALAKDRAKLASAGNMSMKIFVRIEMNTQLINKLKSHPNFKSGHGCVIYFDVAELYEKANTDPEYNRQLLLAAARTMGDRSLEAAVQSGSLGGGVASAVTSGVQNSVKSNIQNSVRSSVSTSVQQSVQNTINSAVSGGNGSESTPNSQQGQGGNGGGGAI